MTMIIAMLVFGLHLQVLYLSPSMQVASNDFNNDCYGLFRALFASTTIYSTPGTFDNFIGCSLSFTSLIFLILSNHWAKNLCVNMFGVKDQLIRFFICNNTYKHRGAK